MDEKVKVKFMRYKNVVLMEVLKMPEKYRGKGVLIGVEGFAIESCSAPGLNSCKLYLRGEHEEYDELCDSMVFNSEKQAINHIKKFSDLIHKLNERDAKKPEKTSDGEFEITIAE